MTDRITDEQLDRMGCDCDECDGTGYGERLHGAAEFERCRAALRAEREEAKSLRECWQHEMKLRAEALKGCLEMQSRETRLREALAEIRHLAEPPALSDARKFRYLVYEIARAALKDTAP